MLAWFSPGFPIGAFSYSHGLETAVSTGKVHDRESLRRWSADTSPGCAMTAYLHAMAANLVSAGLRLGIVGQTDGQRIIAALEPVVGTAVTRALTRDPSVFGGAALGVDLASMAHETQYSRLFRS